MSQVFIFCILSGHKGILEYLNIPKHINIFNIYFKKDIWALVFCCINPIDLYITVMCTGT